MTLVSMDKVSIDLRELTQLISEQDPELLASGLLGGQFGYGCEFSNEVFEMHPFWWDDCICGYEARVWNWENSIGHAADCYQSIIRDKGFKDDLLDKEHREKNDAIATAVALQMGLDTDWGLYVHCTCFRKDAARRWHEVNPHPADCPTVRPNFRHHASGVEVRWYKYIGRSMDLTGSPDSRQWRNLITECVGSLDAANGGAHD